MLKGYTTRQKVENYLLITIDPSFYDTVNRWIEGIEVYIDKMTGRSHEVSASATARLYDGNGGHTLYIDDASEITKVETGGPDNWSEIATADYYKYPSNAAPYKSIYLPGGRFPAGRQNVRVTAKWGAGAIPADIELAATVLVAGIINNAYSSDGEVQSMTIGPYSVTYKDQDQLQDFDKVKEILQLNKRFYF